MLRIRRWKVTGSVLRLRIRHSGQQLVRCLDRRRNQQYYRRIIRRAGNTIAWNESCGVVIDSTAYQNRIVHNSIYSNGGLGIDLGDDGITLNDPLDIDFGAINPRISRF